MGKQVYISADYSIDSGDREVVETLKRWAKDNLHIVDFIDMAEVKSGSVSMSDDCRICDLKKEFNSQINASSAVIFVVGDKTARREAGTRCNRCNKGQFECYCTPYKQNTNGEKMCKVAVTTPASAEGDCGHINSWSYLRHEFEQAKKRKKKIIIIYNSLRNENEWFPSYMKGYEGVATPFWTRNQYGQKVGNYLHIKKELGYE